MPRARLLVADGDALYLRGICRLLRVQFRVTAAASGLEALAEVQRTPSFDGILLDIALRDSSATEVHRALLARYPEQAHRVLFVSWRSNDEVALALGGPVLRKPFSVDELGIALHTLAYAPSLAGRELR